MNYSSTSSDSNSSSGSSSKSSSSYSSDYSNTSRRSSSNSDRSRSSSMSTCGSEAYTGDVCTDGHSNNNDEAGLMIPVNDGPNCNNNHLRNSIRNNNISDHETATKTSPTSIEATTQAAMVDAETRAEVAKTAAIKAAHFSATIAETSANAARSILDCDINAQTVDLAKAALAIAEYSAAVAKAAAEAKRAAATARAAADAAKVHADIIAKAKNASINTSAAAAKTSAAVNNDSITSHWVDQETKVDASVESEVSTEAPTRCQQIDLRQTNAQYLRNSRSPKLATQRRSSFRTPRRKRSRSTSPTDKADEQDPQEQQVSVTDENVTTSAYSLRSLSKFECELEAILDKRRAKDELNRNGPIEYLVRLRGSDTERWMFHKDLLSLKGYKKMKSEFKSKSTKDTMGRVNKVGRSND